MRAPCVFASNGPWTCLARLLELVPELALFVPPARIVDKTTYSPWWGTGLLESLHSAHVDTVVVSGGETDICVLATVLAR